MDILLKDYRPMYTLKVKRTPITKAKFPLIDVHNHFKKTVKESQENIIKIMDSIGIKCIVNLDGGFGNTLFESISKYDAKYPGRFYTFCNIDFSDIDGPDFKKQCKKNY